METLFLLTLVVLVAPTLEDEGNGKRPQPSVIERQLFPSEQSMHSPLDHELTGSSDEDKYWRSELSSSHQSQKGRAKREEDNLMIREAADVGKLSQDSNPSNTTNDERTEETSSQTLGISVAGLRWGDLGIYFTFTGFVIVAGLAKIVFHHAHVISSRVPESCLLILLGTAVGGILYAAGAGLCDGARGATRIPGCTSEDEGIFTFPTFTPMLFFYTLLPPIILESAYSLYDRAFADNVGTILFYAVVGTIVNMLLIGLSLLGLVNIGWIGKVMTPDDSSVHWWSGSLYQLQGTDIFVFSTLISAVDPVAVLAIFQEVGVNKDLYFLLFGESLLNDAVTVVLYSLMVAFASVSGGDVSADQYAIGIASFFTVSLGGFSVGIICGLLTALITRTTSEVRVTEPLAVLGMAYFAYITAELFKFSGIISTIGCGLVQAHYAFANISSKSYTTVKYFIKMLSSTSDAIIFLFLGIVLVNDVHEWHTGFVLWSLFLCLIVRFIGVYFLTALANRFRLKPINLQEQFIMAYGGLRGAVSFSLVEMLSSSVIRPRQLFVTTTLVVILFTVFIQGGTIKLFVRLLHIKKETKKVKSLMGEINETVIDHAAAGIEEICGLRGSSFLREKIEFLDERYMKPLFTIHSDKNNLQRLFEKLTLLEYRNRMYDDHTVPIPTDNGLEQSSPVARDKGTSNASQQSPPSAHASEAEAFPFPPTPLPDQVSAKASRKSRYHFPLARQYSAPSGSWHLPHLDSPAPAGASITERPNLNSLSELDDLTKAQLSVRGVGSRLRFNSGESATSVSTDAEAAGVAFRKALQNTSANQYRKVYQKHNRNLIGTDDTDAQIEMVIRRRLSCAPTFAATQLHAATKMRPSSPPPGLQSFHSPARAPLTNPVARTVIQGGTPLVSSARGSTISVSSTPAMLLIQRQRLAQRSGSLPSEYTVENEKSPRQDSVHIDLSARTAVAPPVEDP